MENKFAYHIFKPKAFIYLKYRGYYEPVPFVETLKEVVLDPDYDKHYNVVIDMSEKNGNYLKFNIKAVTRFVREYKHLIPKKVILISTDPILTALSFLIRKRVSDHMKLTVYSSLKSIAEEPDFEDRQALVIMSQFQFSD